MLEYHRRKGRIVLHVDMNSFFASVEMAHDPELKGKPLAIAGDEEQRRGIVVTCSYEARKLGVKTTMPVWEAKKLCPNLIVKQPNFERYRAASTAMFDILRQFSDLVEPVSIDEGYLDISDSKGLGSPIDIAQNIQKSVLNELDLPCSIGIAPNKFLAKMASDMKKPLGITILRKRDVPKVLWPLPVMDMHGIGEKTAAKLSGIQINTIGQLAQANELQLNSILGIRGLQLKERANGIDLRAVDPNTADDHRSIGNSTTLPLDTTNQSELMTILEQLAKRVSERLIQKKYFTSNVMITIRYHDRKTITRGRKLSAPVRDCKAILTAAKSLFYDHWNGDAIRLLGVTGQDLIPEGHAYEQLDLFSYKKAAEKEPLYKVINEITEKFGQGSIQKGRELQRNPSSKS